MAKLVVAGVGGLIVYSMHAGRPAHVKQLFVLPRLGNP